LFDAAKSSISDAGKEKEKSLFSQEQPWELLSLDLVNQDFSGLNVLALHGF